jgi:SAM-dependent methyltransferase
VGCGTGALTETLLDQVEPSLVAGIDASEAYVTCARARIRDPRVTFSNAKAEAMPFEDASFDAVVSGLVLNFSHEPSRAACEMARVVRPGGTIAAYVWDYAGEMELLRHFWGAAGKLDRAARHLDEARRFEICSPVRLAALFVEAGLSPVNVRAIDVRTVFRDFDDYWLPFLGGQGPAPGYVASLDEERRQALRDRLQTTLPTREDGSIHLIARAWAVRGLRPASPHL